MEGPIGYIAALSDKRAVGRMYCQHSFGSADKRGRVVRDKFASKLRAGQLLSLG
jgi:hypothetical protein